MHTEGWFIYYRVPTDALEDLLPALRAAQLRLQASLPGLVATLMRRADGPTGAPEATLMETYWLPPALPVDGRSVLAARIEAECGGLLPCGRAGSRHVEHFLPCA